MTKARTKLGLLASGRGSNMRAIIAACRSNELDAEPCVMISNNPKSAALEYARQSNIDTFSLQSDTPLKRDEKMVNILQTYRVELVILAGYMQKIGDRTLEEFVGRIINIHPSLLPKYGGKGMYGMHIHRAVLAAGESRTGVSIHQVNHDYDQGKILKQESVAVEKNDTPESLALRVLQTEHRLYPQTLNEIIGGQIKLQLQ